MYSLGADMRGTAAALFRPAANSLGGIASAVGHPELADLWSLTLGDQGIRVALLDGPVDRTHPCFQGANLREELTLVAGRKQGGAASRHGTHVASLIFGQPGTAVSGVAPGCSGILLPVFADGPKDSLVVCSQIDLARAILQALELGAHVINISGGQLTPDGEPDPWLAKAISACAERNVLVVAAAGNDGCDCLHIPAAIESVLPVGATGKDGEPLNASNWGRSYRDSGIVAPGQDVRGAEPGGGISFKTGTSFAAPFVTGVAALLLSAQLKLGRQPDPHMVRRALLASATPCDPQQTADCRRLLAGRLNATGALQLMLDGGVNMSETNVIEVTNGAASIAPAITPAEADNSIESTSQSNAMTDAEAAILASEALSPGLPPGPISIPARPAAARPTSMHLGVTASDCGCGGGATCSCGGAKKPQLVYALGKLGYDFGTEARRDTFVQAMPGGHTNPYDLEKMVEYLAAHPFEAESLIWTLNLDATPIYAIVPAGPFAVSTYERLRDAFEGQLRHGVELVSIPGHIVGSITLLSGQVVPIIVPTVRGIFSWAAGPLIASVLGARPEAEEEQSAYDKRVEGLNNFLSRVYYDLRNLGITAQERALNFSATNAFQVSQVMGSATHGDLELDTISVRKSPVCRPDSDCYDIEIGFFDPRNVNVASKVYRFTVDVSDVMPVTIGAVRSWSKRS